MGALNKINNYTSISCHSYYNCHSYKSISKILFTYTIANHRINILFFYLSSYLFLNNNCFIS